LTDLAGTYGQTWYLLSAGTFLAIIIPLVVFFSLQRYFVRGPPGRRDERVAFGPVVILA